ncbi:MAG: hypothetical protein ACOYLB_04560 [Phototrophicaceae bacterium]
MTVIVPLEFILVWATIRRRWWLILLPLVVLLAVMLVRGAFSPTPLNQSASGYNTVVRFSATQALDAIPNRDGDFQDIWLSSELTVKALITWARTSSFAREVASTVQTQHNLTIDPQLLGIAADHERSVGQLFISWNNPDELVKIAESALVVLQDQSQDYFPQFGDQPARVTVLDDIRITPVFPPITDRFGSVLQIGVALFLGFVLAFTLEVTDRTLRRPDQIAQLGLDILAYIPRE